MTLSATYSPEDNKLRLYSVARLPEDLYKRVSACGFKYAPKQGLFVAPTWTPDREDLLIELCGEIGDEDTSLVDRAAERADRFEDYSESRAREANSARDGVQAIMGGFAFGQPILVGHHSEKKARKDAERIENGIRKSVQMWETAQYWRQRAKGALRHAKYKERPDVRARRIKTLEADKRKQEREMAEATQALAAWTSSESLTLEQAKRAANLTYIAKCFTLEKYPRTVATYEGLKSLWSALEDGIIDACQARNIAVNVLERRLAWRARWVNHINNRIAYEKAMLGEQGGLVSDRFNVEVGGRVLVRGEWCPVLRVNRSGDRINSVTHKAPAVYHWLSEKVTPIEDIADYKAPEAEDVAKVKAASKLAPMRNYPGAGFLHITKAEWASTHSDYKGSRVVGGVPEPKRANSARPEIEQPEGAEKLVPHRVRTIVRGGRLQPVYITDQKRTDPAQVQDEPQPAEPLQTEPADLKQEATPARYEPAPRNEFDAMKEQLRQGVQIVSAPQLFPTPASLAARMVRIADPKEGARVLEPSAGTGRILRAIREHAQQTLFGMNYARTAVEINSQLCSALRVSEDACAEILNRDFLECGAELGQFDAILMNPPFANAQDIAHIKHARAMLAPGGVLVAICANGPRQNEQLRPLVHACGGMWEPLPKGTFEESGTGVNAVLLTLHG